MTLSGLVQGPIFIGVILVFINGYTGWLLLYTILAAVLISFVVCLFSRKGYEVSVEEFSGIVQSGQNCTVRITLRKKGFCFLPRITVYGELSGQKFAAKTSLLFRNTVSLDVRIRTSQCGLQHARITRSVGEDLVGMFWFKRLWELETSVAVLPKRVEYTGPEVVPSLLPSEDEDREEGATVQFGGVPGYEHREYVEGDSPRKINYKLSAKKKQLMVRLDESCGNESTRLVLTGDADSGCAEQAFALAEKLVIKGDPVSVHHHGDSFSAVLPSSVEQLREWLAFRRFDVSGETGQLPSGSVCVVISPQGIAIR